METIRIENAGKNINGIQIFEDINATFESGNIYGLVGRNGSGKTMLMKSICGLCHLTSGRIFVHGKMVGEDIDIPDCIGAIIEVPGFLPDVSGYHNLKYLADIRQCIGKEEIYNAMRTVGLDPESKKKVRKYSLGMRQRLGIAQAIMENQDILILDEPMNGLDIHGVEDVKALLKDLRDQEKTIILTSHHSEDIHELCNIVYNIVDGHMQLQSVKA